MGRLAHRATISPLQTCRDEGTVQGNTACRSDDPRMDFRLGSVQRLAGRSEYKGSEDLDAGATDHLADPPHWLAALGTGMFKACAVVGWHC